MSLKRHSNMPRASAPPLWHKDTLFEAAVLPLADIWLKVQDYFLQPTVVPRTRRVEAFSLSFSGGRYHRMVRRKSATHIPIAKASARITRATTKSVNENALNFIFPFLHAACIILPSLASFAYSRRTQQMDRARERGR
jgi:hypothetical protein